MAQVAQWWTEPPRGPAVFVSHASHDHAMANQVVRALESSDLRCWVAPRDIPAGRSWASAIVDGVEACAVVVLLLTGYSATSPEVLREVELASNGRKHLLTVRLDPRAELSGPLAYFLASIQWIDATARPLGPQLPPLLEAVRGYLGRPATPRPTRPPGLSERDRDLPDGDLDALLRRGPRKRWSRP